jgi:hypothetical protein
MGLCYLRGKHNSLAFPRSLAIDMRSIHLSIVLATCVAGSLTMITAATYARH